MRILSTVKSALLVLVSLGVAGCTPPPVVTPPVPVKTENDHFGELQDTFNEMAEHLAVRKWK